MGKGTIKLFTTPLSYIGDTLASNSNPIKIFFKMHPTKLFKYILMAMILPCCMVQGEVNESEQKDFRNRLSKLHTKIHAVAGALAEGQTEIRDAAELRVKESDRIAEMVKNLNLFGVAVEEKEDGMVVTGPTELTTPDVVIDSHGDHRIAMSVAILNCFSTGAITIDNVGCVDTSYPEFWEHMEALGGLVN